MFESINTLHLVWAGILHITTVFSVLLTLLLISQVLRSQHIPSATMSWLFVIIFVPIIGIPLYLKVVLPRENS